MRTTVNLEEEIFDLAKHLAEQRRISLSEAVNLLIKKGLTTTAPSRLRDGFVVFDVPADAPKFGPADIETALDEEDNGLNREFVRRQ